MDVGKLREEFKKMVDWSRCVIFDENGAVVAEHNMPEITTEHLKPFLKAYENRDDTIGNGFTLGKEHFDLHRFHPPLIYGRRGNCDEGEGICLARGKGKDGRRYFMIVCYLLPIVSARAIPQQIKFFNDHVGELDSFIN